MLRRPQGRDEDLRRVYREHVRAVYAFFAYSVQAVVAEDLTSATFERVVRSWRSFDASRGTERTWILAIARNQLTDHYRRERHRRAQSIEDQPSVLNEVRNPNDAADAAVSGAAFRALVGVLGEREQEILALRFGADLSAQDIAAMLGLTPSNVHQILSRSLRRLRAELAPGD